MPYVREKIFVDPDDGLVLRDGYPVGWVERIASRRWVAERRDDGTRAEFRTRREAIEWLVA
jgi:hypothetical protein